MFCYRFTVMTFDLRVYRRLAILLNGILAITLPESIDVCCFNYYYVSRIIQYICMIPQILYQQTHLVNIEKKIVAHFNLFCL